MGQNAIGSDGAWELAAALQNNSAMLWLGLGANELGDKGAEFIASLLTSEREEEREEKGEVKSKRGERYRVICIHFNIR